MSKASEQDPERSTDHVVRRDRYTVLIDGHSIRANLDQEQRLREMDDAARARFLKVMGRA